jgi:hypothetical protein
MLLMKGPRSAAFGRLNVRDDSTHRRLKHRMKAYPSRARRRRSISRVTAVCCCAALVCACAAAISRFADLMVGQIPMPAAKASRPVIRVWVVADFGPKWPNYTQNLQVFVTEESHGYFRHKRRT